MFKVRPTLNFFRPWPLIKHVQIFGTHMTKQHTLFANTQKRRRSIMIRKRYSWEKRGWNKNLLNMFFLNVRDMEAYQAHMRSDRLNNHVWWTISMVCEGILCTSEM
jgi:hypothetical protein